MFRKKSGNKDRIKAKHKKAILEKQRIKIQREMFALAEIPRKYNDCRSYFKVTY